MSLRQVEPGDEVINSLDLIRTIDELRDDRRVMEDRLAELRSMGSEFSTKVDELADELEVWDDCEGDTLRDLQEMDAWGEEHVPNWVEGVSIVEEDKLATDIDLFAFRWGYFEQPLTPTVAQHIHWPSVLWKVKGGRENFVCSIWTYYAP